MVSPEDISREDVEEVVGKKVIGASVIGSHAWNMDHDESDVDVIAIHLESPRSIVDGTANFASVNDQHPENDVDVASHEASKAVGQLLSGNINYVLGVLSPIVVANSDAYSVLQRTVEENLSKNVYNSVNGLCYHCYRKYVMNGNDLSDHRAAKVKRIHDFGVRVMAEEKVSFDDPRPCSWDDIEVKMRDGRVEFPALNQAYDESLLPEHPPEEEFREWLLKTRARDFGERSPW